MHFFGYRSRDSNSENSGRGAANARAPRIDIDQLAGEPEDGARSRLVFLRVTDEYRIIWEAERLPYSYELFVDGSDKRGIIEISRKQDGSLSVVARALPSERPTRVSEASGGDGASAVWAVRAREKARWEPSAGHQVVRIDLSRDAGATWEPLFDEAPTGGPETWCITGPMAQSRRVRIRALGD